MSNPESKKPITEEELEVLFLQKVGNNIREFREHDITTQAELARKAKIQASYLNDVEKGRRNFSMRILLKISKALDISPDRIMGNTSRRSLMADRKSKK